ncbi:protoheme IX farnesyltransferase, mitochondrial precursor [Lodderomyces elongisporus NRRL YB-4239]|uniref:Protoheme IX farnesyltransferase, mitochondrial n=1 Tax=Lodderomyces elongisporus (strain ATCC 11503 / CBS 2605 / JCM 1781 / NBRC 1676 / NRRL YB-4239) TaxID=379508 RepID=A5E2Y6_LODEL|nr:protoheme IX farnesyltransferase, mitochondrial precursor [Lodderomyces elongisporus NRRL YB-4239]
MPRYLIYSSKFHTIANFNFFINNTRKSLILDHNFLNNQFLIRKIYTPRAKENNYGANTHSDLRSGYQSVMGNVASKVLTCQEPEAKLSQSLEHHSEVTPIAPTTKSTSTTFTTTTYNNNNNNNNSNNNYNNNTDNNTINPCASSTTSTIPFNVVPRSARLSPTNKPVSLLDTRSDFKSALGAYVKLTKPNLTVLVTLSCVCSYAISPLSVSIAELFFLASGTALCSGAANAINMGREPEFDKQMPRTVGRPVVRGLITPNQAYSFAALVGSVGCTMLWFGVNPVVSMLGFFNIVLYAWIYTLMKRKSILNTWVGAIVGAIPPLMGWAASSSLAHPGAWCLAGLLYAWQFPHFNALSHGIAQQYKQAGYVMTAAENPKLNARVALRYSILMFPLCFGLSYFGVTDWVFPFDSALANGWLAYWSFKFWQQQQRNYSSGSKKGPTSEGLALAGTHAKKLFWCSVWHLPAVLILAMLHKKDQWNRLSDYIGLRLGKTSSAMSP